MKTEIEKKMREIGNILIELRKDPSKEVVPVVLNTIIYQLIDQAKHEERERIKTVIKKITKIPGLNKAIIFSLI